MRVALASGVAFCVLLCGCRHWREHESRSNIRAAIEEHLRKQPNLSMAKMTMEIQDIKLNGDRADAWVKFQSKESAGSEVTIHYVMHRFGGHWEVEASSPAGGVGSHANGTAPPRSATPPEGGSAPIAPRSSH